MRKAKEIFVYHKARVSELCQKIRDGEITEEEKKELCGLREKIFIFNTIKKYGFSLVRNKVAGNVFCVDMMAEIEGELFMVFCNVLEKYDGIHEVTTFFGPHFKGAITHYFSKQNGISPYQKNKWIW